MKLNDTQLKQVDAQIKRLLKTESYYGKMYSDAGITGVSSQEDFEKLPFSSKKESCVKVQVPFQSPLKIFYRKYTYVQLVLVG